MLNVKSKNIPPILSRILHTFSYLVFQANKNNMHVVYDRWVWLIGNVKGAREQSKVVGKRVTGLIALDLALRHTGYCCNLYYLYKSCNIVNPNLVIEILRNYSLHCNCKNVYCVANYIVHLWVRTYAST